MGEISDYRKKKKEKKKKTGYIYLAGSKYCEDEGYLKLRSCLKDDVINYVPIIGKYIHKHELYTQCPSKRVKN